MSGHIRQRSPGSWELRYRANGGTFTQTFRGSKKDAQACLRRLLVALERGEHVERSKLSVSELVAQRIAIWDVGARTRENYGNLAKLVSALGSIQLQRLRTLDVEWWHADLRAAGLAPSTIRAAHRMLVRALADAVHHKLVHQNVAALQPPPRAPARKVKVPTEDLIAPMVEALRGDAFYAPAVVAIYCGLRRGEQLALKWSDINLDAGTLRVERALDETATHGVSFKAPKTESGARTISIPRAVVETLRQHRVQQLELALALGLGRPPDDALVFPAMDGGPQSPNAFSVAWIRTVRRLGLPPVTWHGLRHLSASLMLRHGVDLVTVSERLGHSRPDTTARVYAHSIARDDRHAADALDRALGQ